MSAEDLIPSDRLDESGGQSGPSENRSIEFHAWLDLLHKDPSSWLLHLLFSHYILAWFVPCCVKCLQCTSECVGSEIRMGVWGRVRPWPLLSHVMRPLGGIRGRQLNIQHHLNYSRLLDCVRVRVCKCTRVCVYVSETKRGREKKTREKGNETHNHFISNIPWTYISSINHLYRWRVCKCQSCCHAFLMFLRPAPFPAVCELLLLFSDVWVENVHV